MVRGAFVLAAQFRDVGVAAARHPGTGLVALFSTLVTTALLIASDAAGGLPLRTMLFVDRSTHICSDFGPGTSARPFCLIGEAAAVARPGQTVLVAAGTYNEVVTLRRSGTQRAPIIFSAAPNARVIISGRVHGQAENVSAGFHVWNKRWVTVNGFDIRRTKRYGVDVQNSSHIRITNNHVSYAGRPTLGNGQSGIYLNHVSDSLVSGNTVDHNTNYGINVVGGSTRVVLQGNVSFANARVYERAASGIRIYASPRNTLFANVVYDNEDSGIEFDSSADALARANVTFDNGDHGVDVYRSPGATITGNLAYSNVTTGIDVEGLSPGAKITRNTSVENGAGGTSNYSNIRVESGSTAGTTMDYDHVHFNPPDVLFVWDDIDYTSLEALTSATGQEVHATGAAPAWTTCELDQGIAPMRFRVVGTDSCPVIRDARRGRGT
jgi:parallel beta-helix repeat protein